MESLVKTPFSEISATLEILDKLGIDTGVLKRLRSDVSFAQRAVNFIRAGAPTYKIHTIEIMIDREDFVNDNERRYRLGEKVPKTVIWDPSKIKIVEGIEHKSTEAREGLSLLSRMVLDFLLENQDLIPEEWYRTKEPIFFLGTKQFVGEPYPHKIFGVKREEQALATNKGIWTMVTDNYECHCRWPSHTRKAAVYSL